MPRVPFDITSRRCPCLGVRRSERARCASAIRSSARRRRRVSRAVERARRAARLWPRVARRPIPGGRASTSRPPGASGCSIDGLFRTLARLEPELGTTLLGGRTRVLSRRRGPRHATTRKAFNELAREGRVGPDTPVFDTSLTSAAAWREQFERPVRASWHAELIGSLTRRARSGEPAVAVRGHELVVRELGIRARMTRSISSDCPGDRPSAGSRHQSAAHQPLSPQHLVNAGDASGERVARHRTAPRSRRSAPRRCGADRPAPDSPSATARARVEQLDRATRPHRPLA